MLQNGKEQDGLNAFEPPPVLPQGASVDPTTSNLGAMNGSAANNASQASGGVLPCEKKSWFAIRVVDDKDAVIEGLTLKLKLTEVGESDRLTSKAVDPIKIDQLTPGGKGDVQYIDAGELVWEAVGDIT
jgi:hypothetical protein